MPQKFVYISLDIFRKKQQNENGSIPVRASRISDATHGRAASSFARQGIHNKLEAWLTFFCRDEPEMILKLIEEYPEFKALYGDAYELCRNVEGVMQIFLKELLEMDRNTVKLMIDEMQEEIEKQEQVIREKEEVLKEKDEALKEKDEALKEKDEAFEATKHQLEQRIKELEKQLLEK